MFLPTPEYSLHREYFSYIDSKLLSRNKNTTNKLCSPIFDVMNHFFFAWVV